MNIKGTAGCLDETEGEVELEDGIIELEELNINGMIEVILDTTIELAENKIQWRV